MTTTEAVILAIIVLALVFAIIVRNKIRPGDGVKGEIDSPLIRVGFSANKTQIDEQSASVMDLRGENITVGDIKATGAHSKASVSRLDALGNINIGDVTSTQTSTHKES